MNYATVLMLLVVVISTNVSATLIIGEYQMSTFAQSERNTGNVTSDRIQEHSQLNIEQRNARTDINIASRDDRSSSPLTEPTSDSERNTRTLNNEQVQTDTNTPTTDGKDITNNVEVGNSNPNEVGSLHVNEVGSTDSSPITVGQQQDNQFEIAATESDPQRNNRDDPAYQALLDFSRTSVEVAEDNFVDSAQDLVLEHIDEVLAQSQNPSARTLARVGAGEALNTLRGPIGASLDILQAAVATSPAPTCDPGDPSCTPPPPTEEPANCDPTVTGDCFPESGKSPCTPGLVSGATCKSGEITCTQTPLEHSIFCGSVVPGEYSWSGSYFTPPIGTPQFIEIFCTPEGCTNTNH
jgi:hypothetical protein